MKTIGEATAPLFGARTVDEFREAFAALVDDFELRHGGTRFAAIETVRSNVMALAGHGDELLYLRIGRMILASGYATRPPESLDVEIGAWCGEVERDPDAAFLAACRIRAASPWIPTTLLRARIGWVSWTEARFAPGVCNEPLVSIVPTGRADGSHYWHGWVGEIPEPTRCPSRDAARAAADEWLRVEHGYLLATGIPLSVRAFLQSIGSPVEPADAGTGE